MEKQRWLALADIEAVKQDNNFQPSKCTGQFRRAHGISCKHELMPYLQGLNPPMLNPQKFDPHWIIPGGKLPTVMTEQRVLPPRVRYTKRQKISHECGRGINDNLRETTHLEQLDPNHRATPPPGSELASDIQLARRNEDPARPGIPPHQRRVHTNRAPDGTLRCGCDISKGVCSGKCACVKAKKACSIHCHKRQGDQCNHMHDRQQPAQSSEMQLTLTQMQQQLASVTQMQQQQATVNEMAKIFFQQQQPPPSQPYNLLSAPQEHALPSNQQQEYSAMPQYQAHTSHDLSTQWQHPMLQQWYNA